MLLELFEPLSIDLHDSSCGHYWRHPWFASRIQDCKASGLEFTVETFHEAFNECFKDHGYHLKYEVHATVDYPTREDSQRAIDTTILDPTQHIVEVEPQPDMHRQNVIWIWILTVNFRAGKYTLSSFSLDDIVEKC